MFRFKSNRGKLLLGLVAGGIAGNSLYRHFSEKERSIDPINARKFVHVPQRDDQISMMKKSPEYDVLVIGGGAVGTGVALDAVSRGLKTGLIEREDFAAGTSSRSTKLIHGGVRYLEKAVMHLDYGSLTLVFDALHERGVMLNNAPHLSNALPIMTPCYKYWEIPYYWAGLKCYDILAGRKKLYWSSWSSRTEALRQFPMLAKEGLKGTVIYYDGQMDDARINVSLGLTAASLGAHVVNHVEVTSLIKDEAGRVQGAHVRDRISGDEWTVHAKVVVNATGPFTDSIRKMDDPHSKDMIVPSSGVHIVLPDYYSPRGLGLIVPKTSDGRVVFMIPWQGQTIAGTTDSSTKITDYPHPHEDEIQFILKALTDYLSVKVRRSDVTAAWSGIRPLAIDPSATSTASISRDHVVQVSPSNLVTVTGGKWTTYRKMSEDAVDAAIKVGHLQPTRPCQTHDLKVVGGHGWDEAFATVLLQDYTCTVTHRDGTTEEKKITSDIAQHLSHAYGTRSLKVAELAAKYGNKLNDNFPFLEAEVVYAVQEEMAETAVDVIARRLRLAFLDADASAQCSNRIVDLMAQTKGWDAKRIEKEKKELQYFLHIMTVGREKDTYDDDVNALQSSQNKTS